MSPNSEIPPAVRAIRKFLVDSLTNRRNLAVALAVVVCFAAFVIFGAFTGSAGLNGFEVGKVADRDIVAESDVVYIDEKATAVRMDAERRLVPAVFSMDDAITRTTLATVIAFKKGFLELASGSGTSEELVLRVQGRFPDMAASGLLKNLVEYPAPGNAIEQGRVILETLLLQGIFAFPGTGLERYNPETVELRRWSDGPLVYEQVAVEAATTMRQFKNAAGEVAKKMRLSTAMTALAIDTAAAFARENTFFDSAQSERRLEAVVARVEPVMRKIAKGDKVIRQGFIVTADDLERLSALRGPGSRLDAMYVLGGAMVLVLLAMGTVAVFMKSGSAMVSGKPGFIFVLVMMSSFFILSAGLAAFMPAALDYQFEAFLPTALLSMLLAILIGERFAILITLTLSISLHLVTGFDALVPAQALLSGIAGIVLVRKAEKRIDLVRAGAQLALARFICGFALAALAGRGLSGAFITGFWASINGFLCAVLALAFLPVLEQALNAPTVFRLQELSDLNAPALKRLLSVAPGTYSHSITVAHLAESACRAIEADAVLARVGAYYHDIGKMDKPEYFIENQSGYNKHDEINPRLSATVLRGHVKFGLERADGLRLPDNVKAIIAEHHGTSLITYFFDQARKGTSEANSEDYRYPGPLPSSKEAAVVMLADCVEAASRTLRKPTIAKLEQFVKDLVMGRYENGQLVKSDLTFKDLELIKNSFVRVLSGHFHSRIEYPKAREQA